jgi:hypothetical protein
MTIATIGQYFVWVCAVAALGLAIAGVVTAVSAGTATKKRAEGLVPAELIAKVDLAAANAARMQIRLADIEGTLPRITAALSSISASLRDLKAAFSLRR